MNINRITNRWQAFLIHLSISILVFLAILSVILFFWYPHGLIIAGGIQGLKIVAGVDVVLGPLLTLIVFDKTKKSLKSDLSVIAAIQMAALVTGTYLVYSERPILQILSDDGVYLVTTSDMMDHNIKLDQLPKNVFVGASPYKIFLDLPSDPLASLKAKAISEALGETPLHFRVDLYRPYKGNEHLIELRLTNLATSKNKQCSHMRLISRHVQNELFACINKSNGIEFLIKK